MTRRAWKFPIHALGALLGVATVLLAALAWRLAQGPLALNSVTPYIEAAVNDRDLGFRIRVDEAELIWGDWQRTFEIRALGVGVLDDRGGPLLAVEEVVLEMALPSLIQGDLRPRGVTSVRPRVAAVRDSDGAIRLVPVEAFGPEPVEGADRQIPAVTDATAFSSGDPVGVILSLVDEPPFERLVHVKLLGADLLFDDRASGAIWDATAATVSLDRVGDDLALDARMLLKAGRHAFDADVSARYEAASGDVSASFGVADFLLRELPRLAPGLPDAAGLDIPVDGRVDLVFEDDLELLRGSFLVEADGGTVALDDVFEEPVDLGPSRVEGFIRPGFSGLELAGLDLGVRAERLTGRAAIDGFGPDPHIEARIDIDGLAIDDLSRYWPVDLAPAARAWVLGRISDGTVDRASIAFDAPAAALVAGDPPPGSVTIDLDVSGASVDYLPGLPPGRGVDGRVAIVDDTLRVDLRGGAVEALTVTQGVIAMSRLDGAEGVLIGVELSGPVANAFDIIGREPLALLERTGLDPAAVEGRFDGRLEIVLPRLIGLDADDVLYRVSANVDGVALAEGLGGYRIDGGEGALFLDTDRVLLDGEVRLNGVPFAASYRQDFASGSGAGREASLRGAVDDAGRAALGFPDPVDMTGPVDIAFDMNRAADGTTTWNVMADLARLAVSVPVVGIGKAAGEPGRAAVRLVDDGGAVLPIETMELDVGEVSVLGAGAVRSNDMGLVRLDLDRLRFGRNDVTGVVSVDEDGVLDIALAGGTVDLASVMDRLVGAEKLRLPPFRMGGRIDRVWTAAADSVRDVRIDGLRNDAARSVDANLVRFDIDRLRFGRNDVTGVVSMDEDGVLDVALAGGTVDLAPVMDRLVGAEKLRLPPFRVRGRIDRVWTTGDDSARDVRIDGLHSDGAWESLEIAGAIGNGSPVSVHVWRSSGNQRRFEIEAGDAGDALRLFDLAENVVGGTLRARARIDDGGPERPVVGAVRMEGFALRNAPILARILSLASLPALVDTLTGAGLAFDGALIPFSTVGNMVAFRDARLFGPGLGVTFRGRVSAGADLVDVDGTIVPVYLLNAIVGEIPLLGDLLTGADEGGGVFAFTFEVDGPLDDPAVAVNPLSVFAPGFLRNFFAEPTDDESEDFAPESGEP